MLDLQKYRQYNARGN